MDLKIFCTQLKNFRYAKHLDFGELADAADLSENHVRRLEAGKTTPTLNTLLKLAEALGVPPSCLLSGKKYEKPIFLKSLSNFDMDSLTAEQMHFLSQTLADIQRKLLDTETQDQKIGRRICECRTAKGLSSRGMANAIGASPTFIANIEKGIAKASINLLEQICELLQVEVDYILRDESRDADLIALNDTMQNLQDKLSSKDFNFAHSIYFSIIEHMRHQQQNETE